MVKINLNFIKNIKIFSYNNKLYREAVYDKMNERNMEKLEIDKTS